MNVDEGFYFILFYIYIFFLRETVAFYGAELPTNGSAGRPFWIWALSNGKRHISQIQSSFGQSLSLKWICSVITGVLIPLQWSNGFSINCTRLQSHQIGPVDVDLQFRWQSTCFYFSIRFDSMMGFPHSLSHKSTNECSNYLRCSHHS